MERCLARKWEILRLAIMIDVIIILVTLYYPHWHKKLKAALGNFRYAINQYLVEIKIST